MLAWGVILLLTGWVFYKLIQSRRTQRITYQRQDFLLTPEERQCHAAILQAAAEDYIVFAKIRVDDLIMPRSHAKTEWAWSELQNLEDTHFPFVLCHKNDLSVACAIQLIQHRTHRKSPEAQEPSLKTLCQAAGLPLVRLEAGPFYDTLDIRQAIQEAVKKEPLFFSPSDGRREPKISDPGKIDHD